MVLYILFSDRKFTNVKEASEWTKTVFSTFVYGIFIFTLIFMSILYVPYHFFYSVVSHYILVKMWRLLTTDGWCLRHIFSIKFFLFFLYTMLKLLYTSWILVLFFFIFFSIYPTMSILYHTAQNSSIVFFYYYWKLHDSFQIFRIRIF